MRQFIFTAVAYVSISAVGALAGCSEADVANLPLVKRPARIASAPTIPPFETVDFAIDPVSLAKQSIAKRDYRLIVLRSDFMRSSVPIGVQCFTPDSRAVGLRAEVSAGGDVPLSSFTSDRTYIRQYNQTIVDAPDYPFADLCRTSIEPEDLLDLPPVASAARTVTRPVNSLHEAVRRGTIAEVRRFLASTPVNQLDEVGMTSLAWAAARGRGDVYNLLIANGETPRTSGDSAARDDLYWAVATGRDDIVKRALHYPSSRNDQTLPQTYLAAAIASGSKTVVEQVLAVPHRNLEPGWRSARWSAAAVEPVLKASSREFAQELLNDACNNYVGIRVDLIKLALRYGAMPNIEPDTKKGRYKRPLYAVATANGNSATEAVKILLAAGADPNALSPDPPVRPISALEAVTKRLRFASDTSSRLELETRAEMLRAAGAHPQVSSALH